MATASTRRNASLIRGLYYFEAVARHQSVKLAALELGVSQSAVSHQMRELTDALGEQLVTRAGRGISLTDAGRRLADRLAPSFDGLYASVSELVGGERQVLRIAVCSSFGPGWLIPRLGRFLAAHPELDLRLRLYTDDPDQTNDVADGIVTARPVKAGFWSMPILSEQLIAVTVPGAPGNRHRLITTEFEPELGADWREFCLIAKLTLSDIQEGAWLQCTHYLLALEMARAGLGAALVPSFAARRDIERGDLVALSDQLLPTGRTYRFCAKHSRRQEHGIRALESCLRSVDQPISGENRTSGQVA